MVTTLGGLTLSPRDQHLARDVCQALTQIWVSESYLCAALELLAHLFPDDPACIYSRGQDGEFTDIVHNWNGQISLDFDDLYERGEPVKGLARYSVSERDPYANQPVNTETLFADAPDAIDRFRAEFLCHHGMHYQLRATIYDGDRFMAWTGFCRGRRAGEFAHDDSNLFAAIMPALSDGLTARRAVGERPCSCGEIGVMLDAFEEPAFLVTDQGTAVFANRTARVLYPSLPQWLPHRLRQPDSPAARRLARLIRVDLEGKSLWLVLPRLRGQLRCLARRMVEIREKLPPSLMKVAELLASGLSDKEIASLTGLSVPTVRTYVARVFQKLGIHSRHQLIEHCMKIGPGNRGDPE